MADEKGKILIYSSDDGAIKIDVRLADETVWLTQQQLADLYHTSISNVSEHIANIFKEGELEKEATVRNFRTVQIEGERTVERNILHYNLDLIISLGYRISSMIATKFRQWATARLKEYMQKGFLMDDERLKNPDRGYFQELLARIRDIRASEKVFYRQILEIYATSMDYDPQAQTSIEFFKKVQKMIHAVAYGKNVDKATFHRGDSEKEFMELMAFHNAQPTHGGANIAKNDRCEKKLRAMGQLVSGYLDFAKRQAEREIPMTMDDWARHLDGILTMNGEKLLDPSKE